MASYALSLVPLVSEIPRLTGWIEACADEAGLEERVAFSLTLALEEAVANVIAHAFADRPPPHRIALRLDISAESCVAQVTDNGRPFDPSAAAAPDLSLPLDERRPGGLGIHLMRQMVDRLDYRRDGDNNVLRLEKRRG